MMRAASWRLAPLVGVCCLLVACGRSDEPVRVTPHTPVLFPSGATFGDGWSYVETDGETTLRWLGSRGTVRLSPAPRWSTMRLMVELVAPIHLLARPPTIRIVLDGVELDRFEAWTIQSRIFLIPPHALQRGVGPELVIETSETAVENGRTLGLALQRATWDPVGGGT